MGYRRTPFAVGEWYHCFTKGVDSRTVFETPQDFNRFTELLYLANSTETIDRGRIKHLQHKEIFTVPRGAPYVGVGAYCLMDTHPHLLLQEKVEGGITKFMHKILTGYTMYFNIKRERIGNLFITPFRSKHVGDDAYFKRVIQYIHLNPAEILEPGWKQGVVKDIRQLEKNLVAYPYSSAPDYFAESLKRPEVVLLDVETKNLFDTLPSFNEVLNDTKEYYSSLSKS